MTSLPSFHHFPYISGRMTIWVIEVLCLRDGSDQRAHREDGLGAREVLLQSLPLGAIAHKRQPRAGYPRQDVPQHVQVLLCAASLSTVSTQILSCGGSGQSGVNEGLYARSCGVLSAIQSMRGGRGFQRIDSSYQWICNSALLQLVQPVRPCRMQGSWLPPSDSSAEPHLRPGGRRRRGSVPPGGRR